MQAVELEHDWVSGFGSVELESKTTVETLALTEAARAGDVLNAIAATPSAQYETNSLFIMISTTNCSGRALS